MSNKTAFILILTATAFLLQGCFLLEEKHDFGFESILENRSVEKQFSEPMSKVESIKCVNFDVKTSYEKASENWYKVSIAKRLELNGKDISNDYLKLLDAKNPTQIESFFISIVKNEQNLFKTDIVYINPNELGIYADIKGTKSFEDSLKDASFDKADWMLIFSKILNCYNFEKISASECKAMDINALSKYISDNKIKNVACLNNLGNDPEIQAKLKQWKLYEEFKGEKGKAELKKIFLTPFKDNCFKDSACKDDETCYNFKCKTRQCAVGYLVKSHSCVYWPFSTDPKKAKYVYLFVPAGTWQSEEEWKNEVLSKADFMIDVYPSRNCKDKIAIVSAPLSWTNKSCQIDTTVVNAKTVCPNVFHMATCGKEYAKQLGISKVERVIGMGKNECVGETAGYAFFFFDGAYADMKYFLQIPAHETAHTYRICDEYSYELWEKQNNQVKCPNKFPDYCSKAGDCYGNNATILYSNHFQASGNNCREKDKYSIMGSLASNKQCGLDQSAYDALAKQIICS